MTDQKIDEQLRRLSRAVAETSPEPPDLASDSPRPRGVRPVRASSWGFTAALAFGAATLLAIAWWGPGSVEPASQPMKCGSWLNAFSNEPSTKPEPHTPVGERIRISCSAAFILCSAFRCANTSSAISRRPGYAQCSPTSTGRQVAADAAT